MSNNKIYAMLTDVAECTNFYLVTFENMEEYNAFKKVLTSMEEIASSGSLGGYPEIGDPKYSVQDVLADVHKNNDYRYTDKNKKLFDKYNLEYRDIDSYREVITDVIGEE